MTNACLLAALHVGQHLLVKLHDDTREGSLQARQHGFGKAEARSVSSTQRFMGDGHPHIPGITTRYLALKLQGIA